MPGLHYTKLPKPKTTFPSILLLLPAANLHSNFQSFLQPSDQPGNELFRPRLLPPKTYPAFPTAANLLSDHFPTGYLFPADSELRADQCYSESHLSATHGD